MTAVEKNVAASEAAALPELTLVRILGPGPELAGLRIGVRQAGDATAPVVFCLHGIGSNSTGYAAQLSGLSSTYRVIAWDAPGYGRSDNLPWEEPRAENYADALVGLADALNVARAIVIGSSFGAIVAAAFAARYPDRTQAVVLSAPAAGYARLSAAEREKLLRGRIGDMERLGPEGVAEARAPALVAPGSPPQTLEAAKRLVAAVHPRGYAQAAHTLDTADTAANAEKIEAPVLVLVGAEDRVTPAESCARPIHAALRRGRLEVLDGFGHLVKLEAPARFNALVRDFLARGG